MKHSSEQFRLSVARGQCTRIEIRVKLGHRPMVVSFVIGLLALARLLAGL